MYVGIELLLLFALLGAACLDSGGTWFVSAVVWILFGAGAFLLPPLLRQLPLPAGWQRHKALVYFACETLLLLIGLAWEGRNGDFPLPMLPTALLCLALPWGWLGAVRYLPGSRWCRVGLGLVSNRPVDLAGPLRLRPGDAGLRLDQQPALYPSPPL